MAAQVAGEHARRLLTRTIVHARLLEFGWAPRRRDLSMSGGGVCLLLLLPSLLLDLLRPIRVAVTLGAGFRGSLVQGAAIVDTALAREIDDIATVVVAAAVKNLVDGVGRDRVTVRSDGPLRRRVLEDVVIRVELQERSSSVSCRVPLPSGSEEQRHTISTSLPAVDWP